MEWERAKNYILVAFILLNLGLGAVILLDGRYTLTPERERNIRTVLDQNNISLYRLPMRRFPPMLPLDVTGFYYDIDELLEMFFEDPATAERFDSDDNILGAPQRYDYRCGYSRLFVNNGFVTFWYDTRGLEHVRQSIAASQEGITWEEAAVLTTEFIATHFPDFEHDITFDVDGGIRRIYLQVYRERPIFSNRIEFDISNYGIEWIEMRFGQVIGHGLVPRSIFAPDEVLLTFMQAMHHVEEPIIIQTIDMVYFQGYPSLQSGSSYPAVPTYRIFMKGDDLPFLINAFTNTSLTF